MIAIWIILNTVWTITLFLHERAMRKWTKKLIDAANEIVKDLESITKKN